MYEAILPDMLLTVKDVAELLSVARRTVWRWSRLGKLPRPLKLSPRAVRWRASAHSSLSGSSGRRARAFAGTEMP